MSEEEVIKKVISVNFKPDLMRDFILEKGDKATTLKEVKQILHRIDPANAHMKQATEKLSNIKVKEGKEKKTAWEKGVKKSGANMCWLKSHDHAWSKCPTNLISKNFSDKSYTEIPASERYENDFGKKAEKMTKEEKERKKTVSIRKDLHVMTGKTPIAKIDDDASLEDDGFLQFR